MHLTPKVIKLTKWRMKPNQTKSNQTKPIQKSKWFKQLQPTTNPKLKQGNHSTYHSIVHKIAYTLKEKNKLDTIQE